MSTTSTSFTADNWIVDTTAFILITSTILPANWVKIYAVIKTINVKTQQPANTQIIDLTINEAVDECAMIINIPDSNEETISMAAPIAAVNRMSPWMSELMLDMMGVGLVAGVMMVMKTRRRMRELRTKKKMRRRNIRNQ